MNFEIEAPPKKTNWLLWIGLLGIVIVALPIACCAGVAFLGFNTLQAPLVAAEDALEQDARVTDVLGAPIEYQNVAIQNYRNENGQGSAEINSDFAGPNGTARVNGKMNLNSGTWSVDRLEVTFEDGTQLVIPQGAEDQSLSGADSEGTEASAAADASPPQE